MSRFRDTAATQLPPLNDATTATDPTNAPAAMQARTTSTIFRGRRGSNRHGAWDAPNHERSPTENGIQHGCNGVSHYSASVCRPTTIRWHPVAIRSRSAQHPTSHAVRSRARQGLAMRKKTPGSPTLPPAILRDTARSSLFWLLYEHHDALVETWRHRRANWLAVCAWAAEQQIADRDGKPIRADTARADAARKTWERVCAVKAQEKADREARQRPAHVRSPAINQAPTVATPVANRSQPAPAQGMASAEERVAALNAYIRQRSGRS